MCDKSINRLTVLRLQSRLKTLRNKPLIEGNDWHEVITPIINDNNQPFSNIEQETEERLKS